MSLAEALTKAGFDRAEMELGAAVTKFLKSGGTIAAAHAVVDAAAERMSGRGRLAVGSDARPTIAPIRQPVEGGEAVQPLPKGDGQTLNASPPSSNRGGEGLRQRAKEGRVVSAIPVREPKPQRSPIDFGTASVAIKSKLAQSVLDRVKTSDGRAWGDVGAHELDGMGRDGALAQAIKAHIGVLSNAQRFMTVRELVNAETFEAIRSKVHGA